MADTYAAVTPHRDGSLALARALSAAVAAVVILDTAVVMAPGLGLLAVPFLLGAIVMRRGRAPGSVALLVASVGYVALGVSYMINTGLDAESWADLVFALVGTPAAAGLAIVLALRLVRRRSTRH